MSSWSCRPCSTADPTQDTIKVDAALLAAGKENAKPLDAAAEKQRREEAQRCEEAERERQRRLAAEASAAREKEAEARRQEEQRRQRVEEERRQRAALEESARLEREAAEDAARLERDAAEQRAAEERRLEQERADAEKLQVFLASRKYDDVNHKRTSTLFKHKRPLHSAVKDNDPDMARLLLAQGADPTLTNSSGKTARQLAEELDTKSSGSYAAMLQVLPAPV